jgi:hypothetical protein
MPNLEHPSPSSARRDLEDAWRVRSEKARERYEGARARYRKLLEERPDGLIARHNAPLALARHEESEALLEYARILKVFTELTLHGRVPEEQSDAKTDGGRD